MPKIDLQFSIEDEKWNQHADLEGLCQRAIDQAQKWLIDKHSQSFPVLNDGQTLELSMLFTNDAHIKTINGEWRDIDAPTNVLSFPSSNIKPGEVPLPILGDLIFAHETFEREAEELEKPFEEHLTHLIIHGFLHLFGYDHINDDEAHKMEAIETGILASLGLSNPYEEF